VLAPSRHGHRSIRQARDRLDQRILDKRARQQRRILHRGLREVHEHLDVGALGEQRQRVVDDPAVDLPGEPEALGGGHEVAGQAAAEGGGQLSSQSQVAEAVGPVGRDLDIEDRVARYQFVERLAGLALVEQHDARVVIPEQELVRRAEHALAGHAGDLQVTDHGAVGHRGSR